MGSDAASSSAAAAPASASASSSGNGIFALNDAMPAAAGRIAARVHARANAGNARHSSTNSAASAAHAIQRFARERTRPATAHSPVSSPIPHFSRSLWDSMIRYERYKCQMQSLETARRARERDKKGGVRRRRCARGRRLNRLAPYSFCR